MISRKPAADGTAVVAQFSFSLIVDGLLRLNKGAWACMHVCMVITYSKSTYQPDKVANPARGHLNRENEYFSVPVRA